jgi:hypothetical protein
MGTSTNPGLVSVADQAFKPDLEVGSLAVPLDDGVLVPVAGQNLAPATGKPLAAHAGRGHCRRAGAGLALPGLRPGAGPATPVFGTLMSNV